MIEAVSLSFLIELMILFVGFVAWIMIVGVGVNALERRLGSGDDRDSQDNKAPELRSP